MCPGCSWPLGGPGAPLPFGQRGCWGSSSCSVPVSAHELRPCRWGGHLKPSRALRGGGARGARGPPTRGDFVHSLWRLLVSMAALTQALWSGGLGS